LAIVTGRHRTSQSVVGEGIDFSARCEINQRNRSGTIGAADYSSGTAFIVFNPFEVSAQMAATLARIRAASEASGRPVRILYVNPVHEDAFEAAEWLRCTARLRSRWFSTVMSLWVSDAGDAAR